MFSSCPLHVTRVCSLAAVLRPSATAATGSAAFGRAGAFGARWHLHWHAIVSSRQSNLARLLARKPWTPRAFRAKGIKSTGTPHFAPSAKFKLILQVFPT
jgi:hypothetical protein